MNKRFIEVIGWYGVGAILVAYGLVSFSIVSSNTYVYQLLNITGAAAVAWQSWQKRDVQPVALNIIWAIIAGLALAKLLT
jgi:hypothetical protein